MVYLKTLSRVELREYHRELWQWLADNPDKNKWEWPGWMNFNVYVKNLCFACEATPILDEDNVLDCSKCPCKWQAYDISGKPIQGVYADYCHTNKDAKSAYNLWDASINASKYALIIKESWPEEIIDNV